MPCAGKWKRRPLTRRLWVPAHGRFRWWPTPSLWEHGPSTWAAWPKFFLASRAAAGRGMIESWPSAMRHGFAPRAARPRKISRQSRGAVIGSLFPVKTIILGLEKARVTGHRAAAAVAGCRTLAEVSVEGTRDGAVEPSRCVVCEERTEASIDGLFDTRFGIAGSCDVRRCLQC